MTGKIQRFKLRSALLMAFGLIALGTSQAQAYNMEATIENARYFVQNGRIKLQYDMRLRKLTPADFRMGNSSFLVRHTQGALINPVLSNMNPKFTVNSPSGAYEAPGLVHIANKYIFLQIFCRNRGFDCTNNTGGLGDSIAGGTIGERIATITADVVSAPNVPISLSWNTLDSAVVDPWFQTALTNWRGTFNRAPSFGISPGGPKNPGVVGGEIGPN